jgi:thiol-disulfide isomerase/thioredoxin
MDRRAKTASAIAAAALLVGAIAYSVYDILRTRPTVETRRPTPSEAFGINRAAVEAPPVDLAALDGTRVSLADLRGQVVFLNFWATWCPPCREEMPSMVALGQQLAKRHPGKFRMLAVSVDEAWDPVKEYFAAPPFGGPPSGLTVLLDQDASLARSYYCAARGVCPDMKFPETYIVDKTGRLVGFVVGPRDWSQPAAQEYLERLIGS